MWGTTEDSEKFPGLAMFNGNMDTDTNSLLVEEK